MGINVWVGIGVFVDVKNFVGVKIGVGVCVIDIVGIEVRVGVGANVCVKAGVGKLGVMVGTGEECIASSVAKRSSVLPVAVVSMMICLKISPSMGGINGTSSSRL